MQCSYENAGMTLRGHSKVINNNTRDVTQSSNFRTSVIKFEFESLVSESRLS